MKSFPQFYDPTRIGTLFYPDVSAIAKEAKTAQLPPADRDKPRVLLLIIDMQVDFCHQSGSLYVPGAPDDIRRLIEFIYKNAERISHIACSLDSHLPFQIFHPAWWVDAQGQHPAPFTIIHAADLEHGKWKPLYEPEWSKQYVKRLEAEAKKELTIWPYHVLIGGMGTALDPELWSAVIWHSLSRKSQPTWWSKGSLPRTEHYSVIKPEVEAPGEVKGQEGRDLIQLIKDYDYTFIAGEAETHCVLETTEDIVEIFGDQPEKLEKIYLLKDCMSPVVHPEIDFHALAQEKFTQFEAKGLKFIHSTDPFPF